MMTSTTKQNLIANMEHKTKRLIQKKHQKLNASLRRQKNCKFPQLGELSSNSSPSSTNSTRQRLSTNDKLTAKEEDETLYMPYRWPSRIGTSADHRMTNNNRIQTQWRTVTVILVSLILCLVQLTVVNCLPDPAPTPIRVSHSYTKTVSNTIPTSTTSRSTTQITSFLPSDAIPSPSTPSRLQNHNIFAKAKSTTGSSNDDGDGGSIVYGTYKPKLISHDSFTANDTNIKINANEQPISRRLASTKSHTSRKDFTTTTTASIDRPFYTKLTTNDAVASPSYYKRNKGSSSKKKKKKHSTKSSFFKGSSKVKGSKEKDSSSSTSLEGDDDDNEYPFMPATTEKAYQPPKLSLEPFFNFLTSLASASREVILSKEQQQSPNENDEMPGGKYSPSYETINHSIRESAKKSKKSQKGLSKSKKKSKGHKGSKKGNKGSKYESHRLRSAESIEEDEDTDQSSEGGMPIQLPSTMMDYPEVEKDVLDMAENDGVSNTGGLHILDVLRTPIMPEYEPAQSSVNGESLIGTDYRESFSGGGTKSDISEATSSSSNSSNSVGNPPSGRANGNKSQGYVAFDSGSASNASSPMKSKQQRKKQRSELDPMDMFNIQDGSKDLNAAGSISHAQVVASPFSVQHNTDGSFQPSKFNSFPSSGAGNDKGMSFTSSGPQHSPAMTGLGGKSAETNAFGQPHPNGKNDMVSKYPTTFVYQPNSQPGQQPPGAPPPFMGQSPPGFPPNNGVMYGKQLPPSSRPPFKLRPNLHSYYDSGYHNYAGGIEPQEASEMMGVRQPFGPPHFRPPHAFNGPHPLAPPPARQPNGYGNRPGFMMPQRGSHYVGHTLNSVPSSKEPISKPYDYQSEFTGNGNSESPSGSNADVSGSDSTGSASDNNEQFAVSDPDDIAAAENSENKKVGIMDSFDVFYKEYKILAWVAIFFCTSMAFLSLLVYLYINNPPTEVVQARQMFPWLDMLKNPQITRFLTGLKSSSPTTGNRTRKKDEPVDDDLDAYGFMKPYGNGFGGKSGRQRRKQAKTQRDSDRFTQRTNKINRLNTSVNNTTSSASSTIKQ